MGAVRFSWPAWGAASFDGACHSCLSQVITLWDRRSPFSFWLRMPGHEGAGLGSRCRRWRVPWVGRTRAAAPCLLCEVLAVILVLRSGVALALALAWLLLRNGGSLGPRFLLPDLWWRCWSGVARSCSPGQFPASVLVPGPWPGLPRLSPSIRLPPLGRLDWCFWVRSPLLWKWPPCSFGIVVTHFLGISRSVSGCV